MEPLLRGVSVSEMLGAIASVIGALLAAGWLNRRQSRRLLEAQANETTSRAEVSDVEADRIELTMARDLLSDFVRERERADAQIVTLTLRVTEQAQEISSQRDDLAALRVWVQMASRTLDEAGLQHPPIDVPSPRR